jgi:ketosteroid isomerase-like protein
MNTGSRIALLAVLAGFLPGASASDASGAALAEDAAFAAASAERGQEAAFLEFLTDDAIVFRPGPVRARDWFATHEQGEGRLAWTPAAAAADCTGEWAITTGPWNYSSPGGGSSAAGHYLSIWRRQPDGHWRVVLDNGIDHAPQAGSALPLQPAFSDLWQAAPARGCRAGDGVAKLQAAERDLDDAIRSDGLAAALGHAAVAGALAYRDDTEPGLLAASATVDAKYGRGSEARPQFVGADPDSNFGYSYGVIEAGGDSSSARPHAAYIRAWRFDGRQWRVAVDMLTPFASDGGQ